MARKSGVKEVHTNNSSANMNSEHRLHQSDKNKITKIHEMFPNATQDQIDSVLAYKNGDEGEAIDAFTQDGGHEAMAYMINIENNKMKSIKNKKKKKKSKKEMFPSSSFDADDSSSLHSSSNIDLEVEKDSAKTKTVPGITSEINNDIKYPEERLGNPTSSKTAQNENSVKDLTKHEPNIKAKPAKEIEFQHSTLEKHSTNQETLWKSGFSPRGESNTCKSPESNYSEKLGQRKGSFQTSKDERYSKYSSKQRPGSFHRSKTSSLSEDNSGQSTSQAAAMPTSRGYDKCKKDLSRQTTSLQRIQIQLEKGLDDSSKRLKNAFADIRKILDKRQELLEQQMEQTKTEALSLLKSRQELAIELKRRVDRVSYQSESDWLDLRSDIKQYVIERKYDEELANPIWFSWSMDAITENLNNFGEVRPVKNVYSQRSHSVLGNVSNVEPSPLTPVATEENNPVSDKYGDTTETIASQPAAEKEVPAPYKGQSQGSRIFSNQHLKMNRYQNPSNRGRKYNMGRGQPRGHYGGGYNNNYANNNHSNFDLQPEFRSYPPNHSRSHHRPDHQNDHMKNYNRNMNANLPMENRNNEKGSGRGGRGGHNSMHNRSRTNRNTDPRSSTENALKTIVPASEIVKDNANPEKPNAINGY